MISRASLAGPWRRDYWDIDGERDFVDADPEETGDLPIALKEL